MHLTQVISETSLSRQSIALVLTTKQQKREKPNYEKKQDE